MRSIILTFYVYFILYEDDLVKRSAIYRINVMTIGNFERNVTSMPPQQKVIHVAAAFYRECENDNQCRRHGAWTPHAQSLMVKQ